MANKDQSGITSFVNALKNSGAITSTQSGGFAINPAVPALVNFVDSLPSALLHNSENGLGDGDADNINFNTLISGAIQDVVTGAIGATPGLGIDYNGSYYSLSSDGVFSYGRYSSPVLGGNVLESGVSFGPTGDSFSLEDELSNGNYQGWAFGPGGGPFYGNDTNISTINGATVYNQSQTPGIDTNDISGGLGAVIGSLAHGLGGGLAPGLGGGLTPGLGGGLTPELGGGFLP